MSRTQRTLLVTAAVTGLLTGGMAVKAQAQGQGHGNSLGKIVIADDNGKHDCKGKNDCKGQGGCKGGSDGNSCKGQNTCKGKGGCKGV